MNLRRKYDGFASKGALQGVQRLAKAYWRDAYKRDLAGRARAAGDAPTAPPSASSTPPSTRAATCRARPTRLHARPRDQARGRRGRRGPEDAEQA
ncbi:hypothetical protein JL722_3879 [Aureococcus anophagefferens]|nr:hypothetical protein JL722_3879 [Aureococcus anophagefferens]